MRSIISTILFLLFLGISTVSSQNWTELDSLVPLGGLSTGMDNTLHFSRNNNTLMTSTTWSWFTTLDVSQLNISEYKETENEWIRDYQLGIENMTDRSN